MESDMNSDEIMLRLIEAQYDLIARLTAALVWPVVVLAMVVGYRKQILRLLQSLARLKVGPAQFEFQSGLEGAEQKAEDLQLAPAPIPQMTARTMLESTYYTAIQLASISPRAAVIEAWRSVELALADLGKSYDMSIRTPRDAGRILERLEREGLVESEIASLYTDLRTLRNNAVHKPDLDLTPQVALRYAELAARFAAVMLARATRIRGTSSER